MDKNTNDVPIDTEVINNVVNNSLVNNDKISDQSNKEEQENKDEPIQELVLDDLQQRAVELAGQGKSFFLSAKCAGCGKTEVLKHIIQVLKKDKNIAVTASSGCAASHLLGTTIHSWAGINLGKESGTELVRKVRKNVNAFQRWLSVETLIIDEVSMVNSDLLDKLSYIAKDIKRSFLPFGGIQLILCGDFLQLGYIEEEKNQPRNKWIFDSKTWKETITDCIMLDKIYRQNDQDFMNILMKMRLGIKSSDIVDFFQPCINRKFDVEKDGIEPTKLYATKKDVSYENTKRLKEIDSESVFYKAIDTGDIFLLKNMNVPEQVELKKSCQVMLTRNIDQMNGLVNGSRGVVIDFITFEEAKKSNKSIKKTNTSTSITSSSSSPSSPCKFPVVRFINGITRTILLEEWKIEDHSKQNGEPDKKNKVQASRAQIPLILGYSVTIHKSQGMSLDRAILLLNDVFDYGQIFVAVSRVRSLEGLSLINNFPLHLLNANPECLAFYEKISPSQKVLFTELSNNTNDSQKKRKRVKSETVREISDIVSFKKSHCIRHQIPLILTKKESMKNNDQFEYFVCEQGCKISIGFHV